MFEPVVTFQFCMGKTQYSIPGDKKEHPLPADGLMARKRSTLIEYLSEICSQVSPAETLWYFPHLSVVPPAVVLSGETVAVAYWFVLVAVAPAMVVGVYCVPDGPIQILLLIMRFEHALFSVGLYLSRSVTEIRWEDAMEEQVSPSCTL